MYVCHLNCIVIVIINTGEITYGAADILRRISIPRARRVWCIMLAAVLSKVKSIITDKLWYDQWIKIKKLTALKASELYVRRLLHRVYISTTAVTAWQDVDTFESSVMDILVSTSVVAMDEESTLSSRSLVWTDAGREAVREDGGSARGCRTLCTWHDNLNTGQDIKAFTISVFVYIIIAIRDILVVVTPTLTEWIKIVS